MGPHQSGQKSVMTKSCQSSENIGKKKSLKNKKISKSATEKKQKENLLPKLRKERN